MHRREDKIDEFTYCIPLWSDCVLLDCDLWNDGKRGTLLVNGSNADWNSMAVHDEFNLGQTI